MLSFCDTMLLRISHHIGIYKLCSVCMYVLELYLLIYVDVTNLKNTTNSEDTITVTWNNASSPYCGGVLYYIVIISPDERNGSNIMDIANVTDLSLLTATFSNLINDTYYDISVTPYNRVDAGIGVTANIRTSSPVPTQSNNATIPSITPSTYVLRKYTTIYI